ncbi:MAG: hypothetical protein HKN93_04100 [Acidimicrobiia bacterium]|nr:hypothetical protein [Acidimicrobiia bacterium]
MYWYTYPPYGRWAAATLIVIAAFVIELRPVPTVAYPFAARDIAVGEPVDAGSVSFRDVPTGLLPDTRGYGYATRPVDAGEPLTPGTMTAADPIPQDWWLVTVPLPQHVIPGTPARAVLDTGIVDVVIAAPGRSDGFDARAFGTVAVPPAGAADVARAAADGSLVVLVRP